MSLSDPFFTKTLSTVGRAIKNCLSDNDAAATAFVNNVQQRPLSMLSTETLKAIHSLSGACDRAIVEIGAYVGGATVTILHATQERKNLFITIEEPVEHRSHPEIPTHNTINDLNANIRAFGLERENHYIIPGTSFETWVLGSLHHRLLGKAVGLLVWDADTCIDRDLILLSPFLGEGCLLVIDDYVSREIKSARITQVVDDFVRRRILEPIAYLPWATWFGRLRRRPTPTEVAEYRAQWVQLATSEHPYYQRLLEYESRLRDGAPAPLTFDERIDFWRRAAAWRG